MLYKITSTHIGVVGDTVAKASVRENRVLWVCISAQTFFSLVMTPIYRTAISGFLWLLQFPPPYMCVCVLWACVHEVAFDVYHE